ncbi:universal stress protein [Yoonia sp.]|uniref:universal stress protein n=1 Tax=Yoonia sp. TaxID=2212373 RepID=UPI001A036C3B|nr:universal stress protein [Yoonia sp.]MBE0412465.1 universal stress protein [Yoonia sp.]
MAIKNILVAYNGLPGSDAALHGAVAMQRHYGTHLTGLFAHGGSKLSSQFKPWMPQKVQDAIMQVADEAHTELRGKFDQICAAVPDQKRHWVDSGGPVQPTITAYARLYDITILGMHETATAYGQSHIEIYPDRITYDSGRPVIIFPSSYRKPHFGKKTVVAWDGGRAASRALADATRFLEKDDPVEIVSVGRSPFSGSLPGIDAGQILQRHDLNVTLTELPRDRRSIADTLVDHCQQTNADLLVMGAYEHSPLREGLFGGVTRDIGMRANIPVLMSH